MATDGGGPDRQPSLQAVRTLILTGSTLTVCVLAGLGLGWYLDSRLGTTPLLVFVGLVFGIVCGCFGAYVAVRDYLKT